MGLVSCYIKVESGLTPVCGPQVYSAAPPLNWETIYCDDSDCDDIICDVTVM